MVDAPALRIETSQGPVTAGRLMLATGVPVLDRGGYFAKLKPNRSYAMTYRVPRGSGRIPKGMYLSADTPGRTLRTVPINGEELLLIGGNDHGVGRSASERAAVEDLEAWAQQHFPGAERTHVWSAQDYRAAQYVPFFGTLPRGGGRIYLATGYNKWGMSNAVAASLAISAQILGGHMAWAETLSARMVTPSDVFTGSRTTSKSAGPWWPAGSAPRSGHCPRTPPPRARVRWDVSTGSPSGSPPCRARPARSPLSVRTWAGS